MIVVLLKWAVVSKKRVVSPFETVTKGSVPGETTSWYAIHPPVSTNIPINTIPTRYMKTVINPRNPSCPSARRRSPDIRYATKSIDPISRRMIKKSIIPSISDIYHVKAPNTTTNIPRNSHFRRESTDEKVSPVPLKSFII